MNNRGFLMFAHNNPQIDYGLIALCNALMIKKNMKHNATCLVTDEGTISWLRENKGSKLVEYAFDHIVIEDHKVFAKDSSKRRFQDTQYTKHNLLWHNGTRVNAYGYSPFKETILIDCDYLILDSTLENVWGSNESFLINRVVKTLDYDDPSHQDKWISPTGIPMYWATCVYFKKDETAQLLFDMVDHVKENYSYYQFIYGFPAEIYRNDYSFSIAIHTLDGFIDCHEDHALPTKHLLTSFDIDDIQDIPDMNTIIFYVNDLKERWRYRLDRIEGMNVHVMNKFSIVRNADKIISLYEPKE